mmetsp:Transcript_5183/g.17425  ORF Transcript_5183/g.17425 Transcript_5183/m.17425 type:complete len:453 (+) Transcript_5183:1934-3292(+)
MIAMLRSLAILLAPAAAMAAAAMQERTHRLGARLCDDVEQYSGYYRLTTGSGTKNYFYWAFRARTAAADAPVVLWLTGGPGCSSELALFAENGPCSVNANGTGTVRNPNGWNEHANLIFVDQPTGTGFSYGTGYDHDEVGVADDMNDFLQQFFAKHADLADNDFYVAGESYAGHYIPNIAHRIWRANKDGEGLPIKLKGIAIGNGLTDPEIQYAYYPDMAASTNGHEAAVGSLTLAAMRAAMPACLAAIRACNSGNSSVTDAICTAAMSICNLAEVQPYQATGLNVYDMRVPCKVPGLCYDFSNIDAYLRRPEVLKALGVDPRTRWEQCSSVVNLGFRADWMKDYQQRLPDLLADGIRVLIYAGDQDYICNWLGNKAWTLAMDWPGKAAFNSAGDSPWMAPASAGSGPMHAGDLRTAKGFTFLRVFAAGHMVPLDQPVVSLHMIDQFIGGKI